jgi:DNA ligase-1
MVFDVESALPYRERVEQLRHLPDVPWLTALMPTRADTLAEFLRYEEERLSEGYEGVMVRSPFGPYKCGRSTLHEGYLLKYKRYQDSEAVVLGFEEGNTNENPIVPNAFGYAKRPGGSEGLVPNGTLGRMRLRDIKTGVEFSCGTGKGLTHNLRMHIWTNQEQYIGRLARYTYQACGSKDRPRFPVFQGFRDPEDVS